MGHGDALFLELYLFLREGLRFQWEEGGAETTLVRETGKIMGNRTQHEQEEGQAQGLHRRGSKSGCV